MKRRRMIRRGGDGHEEEEEDKKRRRRTYWTLFVPRATGRGHRGGDSSLRPSGGGISARCSVHCVLCTLFTVHCVQCALCIVCTVQCAHGEGWRGGGAVRSGAQSKQQQQQQWCGEVREKWSR